MFSFHKIVTTAFVLLAEAHLIQSAVNYGDNIYVQNGGWNDRWLTGSRGTDNQYVKTRNQRGSDYEISLESTYIWTIQSITTNGRDPKDSDCLRYGDKFYLKNNYMSSRWLSGSRGGGNEGVKVWSHQSNYETTTVGDTYKWIARSNAGIGRRTNDGNRDPAFGLCIEESSIVFLQNNYRDNRWLSGSRGGGNEDVVARNMLGSDYEKNTVGGTYTWILRRDLGGGLDDSLPCAAVAATGSWVFHSYRGGSNSQQHTYCAGVDVEHSMTNEQQTNWETSVTTSVSGGFTLFGAGGQSSVEVSASLGQEFSRAVSETVSMSEETCLTSLFSREVLWQFKFTVTDLCNPDGWTMSMASVAESDSADEPPCCLPGYKLGLDDHGPCKPGTPCMCSEEVCNRPVNPPPCDGNRFLRG